MEFFVGENIKVHKPDFDLVKWCCSNLVLDNPDFYKRERMGKWTGGVPRKLFLYEKVGDSLFIPFGCLNDLWKLFKNEQWEVHDRLTEISNKFEYGSKIKLYPYQEAAVQATLKKRNGVLVMPCGSGKTQSGLEIIARLGGRALWLTHTQDLLNQSKKRAESVLKNVGCGTITEGKVDIGSGITFATVQTLSKLDLIKYRDMWDVVIVDECQHCAGSPTRVTQFYKVMSNLRARYKIGLTATPDRADGLQKSMFALLGNVIHEVSREEVADTTCQIKALQMNTGWFPDDDVLGFDGTIDYMKVIDSLTHNEDRTKLVLDTLKDLKSCIVLANRVEFLQRLKDGYTGKAVCLSGGNRGKKAKEERKMALEALNNGEIDCIFATYQLAKEGLDVPRLKYIVFATPEKDKTTVVQAAGRVGRAAEGKEYGTVIDFVDDFGMYKGWAKKRVSYYKEIGAEIL